ncbi:hypothetical protein F5Y12DRAFT_798664 [Xylaria sp. FL1777]|nr:hypothetical protein F5Y12DRAFT_798664 [Xylaria sp. FL1777]
MSLNRNEDNSRVSDEAPGCQGKYSSPTKTLKQTQIPNIPISKDITGNLGQDNPWTPANYFDQSLEAVSSQGMLSSHYFFLSRDSINSTRNLKIFALLTIAFPATDGFHIGQPQTHRFRPLVPNQFRAQEASQRTHDLQASLHPGNFQSRYAQMEYANNAPRIPRSSGGQNNWMTSHISQNIPSSSILGRSSSQIYGDARDYLSAEQQQSLTSTRDPQLNLVAPPEINPFLRSPNSSHRPFDYDAMNIRSASQVTWPPKAHFSPNVRSGYGTDPTISEAGQNPRVYEIESIAPAGSLALNGLEETPKPSKTRFPMFNHLNRAEICPDYSGTPTGNPFGGTLGDSTGQNRLHPFMNGPREARAINDFPLPANPYMAHDDENAVEVPTVEPPRGPIAIIMNDNYNIYNRSLLARVAEECEKGMYNNTPSAIATYHQLGMADDLYYGGIWKGRFMVNQSSIIEFHNPAQSRPKVADNQRKDRRQIFIWTQDSMGKRGWCKVVGRNKLVPAVGMKEPPAEFSGVLDLWRYFFNRVPCEPDVEKYAELVALQHVDCSPDAANANMTILGMVPGANKATAALRIATKAEALAPESLLIPNFIPAVEESSSDPSVANTPAAELAPVDPDIAVAAPTTANATFPPIDSNMASRNASSYPTYLSTIPEEGVASDVANMFTDAPPQVNNAMISNGGDSHFSYPDPDPDSDFGTTTSVPAMPATLPPPIDNSMDLDLIDPSLDSYNPFFGFDATSDTPVSPLKLCAPFHAGVAPEAEEFSSFRDFMDFEEATRDATTSEFQFETDWFGENPFDPEGILGTGNSMDGDYSLDNTIFHNNLFATNNLSGSNNLLAGTNGEGEGGLDEGQEGDDTLMNLG